METPIFKLIEKDLQSYKETIDRVLNELNKIDHDFKNLPIASSIAGRYVIDKEIYPLVGKIDILSFKVYHFSPDDIQE